MIIDRRTLGNGTNTNVQRYIRRRLAISKGKSRQRLDSWDNDPFNLIQPYFAYQHDSGIYDRFIIGNNQYVRGDEIEYESFGSLMANGGYGSGSGDSDDGDAGELIEYMIENDLFSECRLPNLTKKSVQTEDVEVVRAGYSTAGGIVNMKRTFLNSIGRRAALKNPLIKQLEVAKSENNTELVKQLEERIKKIPYIDDIDVRYNRYDEIVIPSTKMVIFLILDVSASMMGDHRILSRMFSYLVTEFLRRNYDKYVIEYIIFTSEAEVVDEEEFFTTRRSGSTNIESSLIKLANLIESKYDDTWNRYTVLFTDSETDGRDIARSNAILENIILPYMQFFIYSHVLGNSPRPANMISEGLSTDNYRMVELYQEEDVINEFMRIFGK